MISRVATLLCLAVCVLGDGHHAISEQKIVQHFSPEHHGHHGELGHIGEKRPEHHEEYAWAYPAYEFHYRVEDPHTHDFKGQHETRHGDEVQGEYWLMQPDGRKRIVKYRSDKHTGFEAHVHYEPEHAIHPEPHHKPIVVEENENKREEQNVERRESNQEQGHHKQEKKVVEVRTEIHHPPPHHHHHEEHKPVVVHVERVEHKPIVHHPKPVRHEEVRVEHHHVPEHKHLVEMWKEARHQGHPEENRQYIRREPYYGHRRYYRHNQNSKQEE